MVGFLIGAALVVGLITFILFKVSDSLLGQNKVRKNAPTPKVDRQMLFYRATGPVLIVIGFAALGGGYHTIDGFVNMERMFMIGICIFLGMGFVVVGAILSLNKKDK